ncbi:MAG: helix-turn-helix transcriptional regulator [Clostridia bacterium]|nr:helix-turn-helix transcriptional regulator [Clostridia bacterium]
MRYNDQSFCRQLKASRIERGVSQVRLAREIGVSLCIISLWEHGNREPLLNALVSFAVLFDAPRKR